MTWVVHEYLSDLLTPPEIPVGAYFVRTGNSGAIWQRSVCGASLVVDDIPGPHPVPTYRSAFGHPDERAFILVSPTWSS